MQAFENIKRLAGEIADLAVLSLFVVAGLIFFLPGVQKRWSYGMAAFVLGTVLGLAARRAGIPDGLDIIAVMLGVMTGPVSAAKLQGKTITEAIAEIKEIRVGGGDDDPDTG
jgi:hypothetical protein